MSTTPVRFTVMEVHCRHCHAPIKVEIPATLNKTPNEQLVECARQAEALHVCPKLDDMAEPEEPAVP